MSDLAPIQLKYRQLLVTGQRLEKELIDADLVYEEAHHKREQAKNQIESHYAVITAFIDESLGAGTSERLKLRLVFDGLLKVDNVSIAGIKPGKKLGGTNERCRPKILCLDREET